MATRLVLAAAPAPFDRAELLRTLPWLLVASTPALFALASWSTSGTLNKVQAAVGHYGLPVILVEVVFVVWAILSGASFTKVLGAWPTWAKAAIAVLAFTSVLTGFFAAPDPVDAIARTWMSLLHLAFGLSVYALAKRDAQWLRRFFWPAVIAGLGLFTVLLVVFVASIDPDRPFRWRYFGFAVVNVRQLGFYSAVGAAASIAVAVGCKGSKAFLAAFMAASIMFAISFWSGTRGSVSAVWLAYACGLLWFPQLRRGLAFGTLVATTFAGAWLASWHTIPDRHYGLERLGRSMEVTTVAQLTSGRLALWADTIRHILERPLFGYGEDQFRQVVELPRGHFNHPHNMLLQALFSWGTVGATCFFALAGSLLHRCGAALSSLRTSDLSSFLVATSLLIMSLFEGTLFHPYPTMMIAASIALLLVSASDNARILGGETPAVPSDPRALLTATGAGL